MREYFVITTENCGRCKKTKAMAEHQGVGDKISFLDFAKDDEAKELSKKFGIRSAGTIHRTCDGTRINLSDIV